MVHSTRVSSLGQTTLGRRWAAGDPSSMVGERCSRGLARMLQVRQGRAGAHCIWRGVRGRVASTVHCEAPLPCTPLAIPMPIPSHISPVHLQASPGVEFRFHCSSASVCLWWEHTFEHTCTGQLGKGRICLPTKSCGACKPCGTLVTHDGDRHLLATVAACTPSTPVRLHAYAW